MVHLAKFYYLIKYLYFYHVALIFKNLFLKYYISKQSSLLPSWKKELIAQALMKDLRMLFLLNYVFTLNQFEKQRFPKHTQIYPKHLLKALSVFILFFLHGSFPSFVLDGGG